jgi:ABC-type antimicrobial peptide transport system permease subunit
VLAVVIAIVGLYGVMAFLAAQRRQEIGVRMALGATQGHAVWLVVGTPLAMVGAGVVGALPVLWALRRFVESQLFGVTA